MRHGDGETARLTVGQAVIRFLAAQHSERDGVGARLIEGVLGIFGHGNVAGLGEALQSAGSSMPFHMARNEQSMVHTATGFARMRNRLSTLACTTSVGPGATNMVTGAALATINRLPVLLLPGDVFASRRPDPVLQQLESSSRGDISVNDCFVPVSRYFDRVMRPEQLPSVLLSAMRVLTSPADTGAVTIALPQDVQAEAFDFPAELFRKRVWHIARPLPDVESLAQATGWIKAAQRPLIVSGGGVTYSNANAVLADFVHQVGIPVAETQAGKGSIPFDHPMAVGAIGATGGRAANQLATRADLVIGIGTRWSDFTTASKSIFQNSDVRFININVAEIDSHKHAALGLVGDARDTLKLILDNLNTHVVPAEWAKETAVLRSSWLEEIQHVTQPAEANSAHELPQRAVIGALNRAAAPDDVIVCAAGSLPGDLHKLWQSVDPKQYHVEYGYSCMGYEIAGALGVKMAAPERTVFALVGDGSYLMLNDALISAVEENRKLIVVLLDNRGFASIGALSRSIGSDGFGTLYRQRQNGSVSTDSNDLAPLLPVDLARHAAALGADVIRVEGSVSALADALTAARRAEGTTVIYVRTDRHDHVDGYGAWWEVPVAEISGSPSVMSARKEYELAKDRQRWYV